MPPLTTGSWSAVRNMSHRAGSMERHADGLKQISARTQEAKRENLIKSNKSRTNNQTEVSTKTKDYLSSKLTSELDFTCVLNSVRLATESCWYYGECSSSEAKRLLQPQPVGAFILRNSSDPKHLFALSVRTERGPTSVRISYSGGLFQIDCEEHLKDKMPKCENIIELVNFHMALTNTPEFKDCRWLEGSGKRDMVVSFNKPRRNNVPSLAHLARLSINSALQNLHLPNISVRKLPVAKSVQRYLEDYPYVV